ncbi:hypothetical protein QQX98_012500 [Neonectria punicea]|uniref:Ubiquitin-like domain-containing protein n=1 Tax=Neonectria punicea TaxID=979145 RepID=A0ABR1GJ31_9HYPO
MSQKYVIHTVGGSATEALKRVMDEAGILPGTQLRITMEERGPPPYQPHQAYASMPLSRQRDDVGWNHPAGGYGPGPVVEVPMQITRQFTCVRMDDPESAQVVAPPAPSRGPRVMLQEPQNMGSSSMPSGQSGASFAPQTYGGSYGRGGLGQVGGGGYVGGRGHGHGYGGGYGQGLAQVQVLGGGARIAERATNAQPQPQTAQPQRAQAPYRAIRPVQLPRWKLRKDMTKEEKADDNRERRERRNVVKADKTKSGTGQQLHQQPQQQLPVVGNTMPKVKTEIKEEEEGGRSCSRSCLW